MPRRILEGKVVSTKQDKTATVLVERRYMHPIYKKYLKKSEKFAAHDENNEAVEGATIQIIECAPISKRKRWTLFTGAETTTTATKPKAETKAQPKKETKTEKPAAKKAPAKKAAAKKEDK